MLIGTHAKNMIVAALVAALFGATPTGLAGWSVSAPETQAPGDPEQPTTVEDLLALAGIEGSLGLDLAALDAQMGGLRLSPSSTVDQARDLLASLSAGQEPSAVFAAAAGVSMPAPVPQAVSTEFSLEAEVLALYARLGAVPSALELAQLSGSASSVDAELAPALAQLVAAVNAAIDASQGTQSDKAQAAADVLATIEALRDQAASPSVSTGGACPQAPIFEDPLQFIIVNGTCDDVYVIDRVIQVDLGGSETYLNNAGGTDVHPDELFDLSVDPTLPDPIDESDIPLGGIITSLIPPTNIVNLPGVLVGFLTSCADPDLCVLNTDALLAFALGCADLDLCIVDAGIEPAQIRENSPVAVSVDLGAGIDAYTSDRAWVQGATSDGVGILFDAGGSDTYTATNTGSQGSSLLAGIGLLADAGGSDTYSGQNLTQGSANGGFLLDLGSGDDDYTAGPGSQGSRWMPFLVLGMTPSVLFDAGGDDTYTADGNSQGAGNILVDASGTDVYTATGLASPDPVSGFTQGSGIVFASGLLVDGNGDDQYFSDAFAGQAFGRGGQAGLVDFAGDDFYSATGHSQGYCDGQVQAGGPGAILFDGAGDDVYVTTGDGQGRSDRQCLGALVDVSGNDAYTAGDRSQGSTTASGSKTLLGALVDGRGHDSYTAGSISQGYGENGFGLLLDADGTDLYTADAQSQGSGTAGGVGILVDGTNTNQVQFGGLTVSTNSGDDPPGSGAERADQFFALERSQGSGTLGGIGLLYDHDDETVAHDRDAFTTPSGNFHPAQFNTANFTAGNYSQGASTDGGIGALINREGDDRYTAGIGSQGSSTNGTAGVFVDVNGRDTYTVSAPAVSRGYGDSTLDNVAVGLFLDLGDNEDTYDGVVVNNYCQTKGDAGVTIDMIPPFIPAGCEAVLVAAITALAGAVQDVLEALIAQIQGMIQPPAGHANPCTGAEVFCNSAENGFSSVGTGCAAPCTLTRSIANNLWQNIDQNTQPSQDGINAHSGTHYFYVGTYPGTTYQPSVLLSILRTPNIVLPATATTLEYDIHGQSEVGFDFLRVEVVDTANVVLGTLATYDAAIGAWTTQSHSLATWAGQTVRIQFVFEVDPLVQEGPGWSLDDIRIP